jgi:ABC-2 type transport system permease protein
MNKIFLVIKREYLERVRSKWFLISTLLGPIMMAAFIAVPVLVGKMTSPPSLNVAIVDTTNDPALSVAIEKKLEEKNKEEKVSVRRETAGDARALEDLQKRLAREVEDGSLQGYLLIEPETVSKGKAQYFAKNVTDFSSNRRLENAVTDAVVERRLSLAGMDASRVAELSKPVDLKTSKLQAGGAKEDTGQSFILSIVLMTMIYMMTLLYGTVVLRGVAEEKQSRIIEVIISSISPLELMFGKIIGIGLVGLTQFIIWGISALILPTAVGAMAIAAGSSMPDISVAIIIYFIIYFILGYFLYATLYAMVGSLVSNEQDANQLQAPVTILIVIPIMLWSVILRDPNSTAAIVLSMIPFFAPILMFLRITIQMPPFWQIAASIALMLLTTTLCAWIGGKIYRVGILMYGKRPTLPELIKWLRYT